MTAVSDIQMSQDDVIALAWTRLRKGDFQGARELSTTLLAAGTNHSPAFFLLGAVAFENDDLDGAVDYLERAIEADPGAIECYEYFEMVLNAANRTVNAQAVAERARRARLFNAKFGTLPKGVQHYQRMVDGLRESSYMNFPREVAIETMAVCNAACVFCPYPNMERKGDKMSDALIDKILRDLEDIPRSLPFIISPFKVNDPLLDVRLFDILERCNERLPNAALRLFTNGSPLTEKHLHRLRSIRGVEHLWISLNHHVPERYQEIMKLPWKRTIEKLELVHRMKAASGFDLPVLVSRVCDGSADDQAFVDFLRDKFPLFQAALVPQSEWLGQVEGLLGSNKIQPVGCGRWFELSIAATGQVAFCCMDGKVEYPVGDTATTHVLDIYNSPGYRMYREKFATRLDGTPCRVCTNL